MEKARSISIEDLKYIVSLINDGESGEAFKEFKRQSGIINVFKCTACGKEFSKTTGMLCIDCDMPAKIVAIIKD